MSYLARLQKGEFSQKRPHDPLTKATKAPFDSFDGYGNDDIHGKPADRVGRWRVTVDGKTFYVIDPEGKPETHMHKHLSDRFGSDRLQHLEPYESKERRR